MKRDLTYWFTPQMPVMATARGGLEPRPQPRVSRARRGSLLPPRDCMNNRPESGAGAERETKDSNVGRGPFARASPPG